MKIPLEAAPDRVWPAVVPHGIIVHGHGTTAALCNSRCHVVENLGPRGR